MSTTPAALVSIFCLISLVYGLPNAAVTPMTSGTTRNAAAASVVVVAETTGNSGLIKPDLLSDENVTTPTPETLISAPRLKDSNVTVTSCELTTERRLTVIKSGGFPSAYGSGVDCKYSVRRYSADVCSVTFLFNVFDLETSELCRKDFLQVDGGEKLCGSKPTGFTRSVPFHHPEEEVTMWFHSDPGSRGGAGFMTTVVQRECPPPDCDRKFSDPSFEIRSPNFPEPYENRQLCDYTVVKSSPKVCRLRLEVVSFDVESAEHCDADSVEIKGNKLCGNLPSGEIVSVDFTENILVLRFRSDHATTRDGFQFRAKQEETGCEREKEPADIVPATSGKPNAMDVESTASPYSTTTSTTSTAVPITTTLTTASNLVLDSSHSAQSQSTPVESSLGTTKIISGATTATSTPAPATQSKSSATKVQTTISGSGNASVNNDVDLGTRR